MRKSIVVGCLISLTVLWNIDSNLLAENDCSDQFKESTESQSIKTGLDQFFLQPEFWNNSIQSDKVGNFFSNIEHFFIGNRTINDMYFMAPNPLIRLESWYGREDPEYNKRRIGPALFEETYANIPEEYLFIIYFKTFYTKILQGDMYKEQHEGYFPVRFFDSGRNKKFKFNDNYSIKTYAQDSWNLVKQKSIYEKRDINCIDPSTLTFIATYMLMSEYGVDSVDRGVNLEQELIELYQNLDYLNKIYVIIFLSRHPRSSIDRVQSILDNIEAHIALNTYKNTGVEYASEYSHRFYKMIHSLISRSEPKF